MLRKILVPLDGSKAAERALDYLDSLPAEHVWLATVFQYPAASVFYAGGAIADEIFESEKRASQEYLESLRVKLQKVPTVEVAFLSGDPAQGILELATREECDLILMTSHGRSGLQHFLLGSVAERVARHATCPVMIVGRPKAPG